MGPAIAFFGGISRLSRDQVRCVAVAVAVLGRGTAYGSSTIP